MMIKQIINIILFFLISGNVFAEFKIYTVDKKLEAVFPSNPQLTGSRGEGVQEHRSYNYVDEDNLIFYTATYQVGMAHFKKDEVKEALSDYVKGQTLAIIGSIKSYRNKNINGNSSAIYHIDYSLEGVPVRKYGIVSYKDGRFYNWAVQDFPSISKIHAKDIFNEYFSDFSVK